MPRNVKLFAWIWIASALLAFPEILLTPASIYEPAKRMGLWSGELKLMIGAMLLLLAILLPFFQMAVWGKKNWARWVLLSAFIASLPAFFFDRLIFRPDYLAQTVYIFAGTVFEALGFVFLFTGDARAWFRPQNSN